MTTQVDRRATSRNKLENRREEVIGAFVLGTTWSNMLEQFDCSRGALARFLHKYEAEIAARKVQVAERTQDIVLTTKEGRIRELAKWYARLEAEADEYGVTVVEETTETKGEGAAATTIVAVTRDFRGQLVKEARGLIDDIAKELGHRAPPQDNRPMREIIIREYGGFNIEELE